MANDTSLLQDSADDDGEESSISEFYVHKETGEKLWEPPPPAEAAQYTLWCFDADTGEVTEKNPAVVMAVEAAAAAGSSSSSAAAAPESIPEVQEVVQPEPNTLLALSDDEDGGGQAEADDDAVHALETAVSTPRIIKHAEFSKTGKRTSSSASTDPRSSMTSMGSPGGYTTDDGRGVATAEVPTAGGAAAGGVGTGGGGGSPNHFIVPQITPGYDGDEERAKVAVLKGLAPSATWEEIEEHDRTARLSRLSGDFSVPDRAAPSSPPAAAAAAAAAAAVRASDSSTAE